MIDKKLPHSTEVDGALRRLRNKLRSNTET